MNYWLAKSEPSVYNIDDLQKDKTTTWDGVRNYAARLHLRAMKKNDLVLFYHSNERMAITGIAKVATEAYQDPTTSDERWVAVDLKFYKKFKRPIPLSEIKKVKNLGEMALIRISRLSVQPVSLKEWEIIMQLAGEE
ncbi:MAG: EVE domain-containing protein [Bacteroidetes bacterium]|nr:EVE domain-containing protein [Bacteroidota bacterium]